MAVYLVLDIYLQLHNGLDFFINTPQDLCGLKLAQRLGFFFFVNTFLVLLEDFLVAFFLGFPQLEVLYASSVVYVLLPHNQITRPQGSGPEVGLGVNSPFFFFFLAFATSFLHKIVFLLVPFLIRWKYKADYQSPVQFVKKRPSIMFQYLV